MSLTIKLAFVAVFYLLSLNAVLAAEHAAKEGKAPADAAAAEVPVAITAPVAPYAFAPEIIDSMREKMMVLMGVEPEKPKETETKHKPSE